ncbi:MAG: GTPase Era [Bacteroidota bacterium]
MSEHKSGFVNIIGQPNVGKSTLLNALIGERMSIITNKPQTTRHRIIGILNEVDYQIVFSDTPGMIKDPSYKMQSAMNSFAYSTFEDADIMLYVVDVQEEYKENTALLERLNNLEIPLFLVLNKTDTITPEQLQQLESDWRKRLLKAHVFPISALLKTNTTSLLESIIEQLSEGPAYYPKDQFTDRSERFFMSEIIREKILLNYHQEIPYSVEVIVDSFKETKTNAGEDLVRIHATIFVERPTQKSIMIGKNGKAIKQLGTDARKAMETFLERKVFLELHIKVKDNWRNDDRLLKQFGYKNQ